MEDSLWEKCENDAEQLAIALKMIEHTFDDFGDPTKKVDWEDVNDLDYCIRYILKRYEPIIDIYKTVPIDEVKVL